MKGFNAATITKVLKANNVAFTYVDGQSVSGAILIGVNGAGNRLDAMMVLEDNGFIVNENAGGVQVRKHARSK